MAKKTSTKKPIKEEKAITQTGGTDQESQFDVVPKDEGQQPDTTAEIPEQTPTPEAPASLEQSAAITESQPEPSPIKPKPLSMASLQADLIDLRKTVEAQAIIITQILSGPILKRKPVASVGKVQIKDTTTGRIFKSKNNTYQTLLKEGALADLVKQGVFGDIPNKNSFGWYALNRACQNRFIEINPETQEANNEPAK